MIRIPCVASVEGRIEIDEGFILDVGGSLRGSRHLRKLKEALRKRIAKFVGD